MKTKDLKNLIKTKADAVEIKDCKQSLLLKINNGECDTVVKENKAKKKTFVLPSILASVLTAALIVAIVLILPTVNLGTENSNSVLKLSRAKQHLSYEVAALGNTIESDSISARAIRMAISDSEAKKIVDDVDEYLYTGEMLFDKSNVTSEIIENDNTDFDYEYKMVVDYKKDTSYIMYFNENATSGKKSSKHIDEESSKLNGILVCNSKQYKVKGEKTIESTSGGQKEFTMELIVYETDNTYVKITQEIEKNENEYTYEFFENGKRVQENKIELETHTSGKKEMTISLEDWSTSSSIKKEYKFEYKDNGNIECEVEFENSNNKKEQITLRVEPTEDGFYVYNFGDNPPITRKK